ncbi:MAG: ATP-binding cassette domain-containing protein, partial [Deinococcales bacterium]
AERAGGGTAAMSLSGEDVLVVHDVRKAFRRSTGETVQALDGVSVEARSGTLTVLAGPDGAGKTTLIRLVAGLLAPDEGSLQVAGFDAVRAPQEVQDRIGYMPQRFGLYDDLSVRENLDLYADLHGVVASERRRRYEQLLAMTGLEPFQSRPAGRLSGGMKQKLGLACTLVRSPKLLILDEPTVGVDPLSRRELWEIVRRLVREEGHSVLVSTSYLDEAESCDHAVVLYAGRVLAQGAPRDIMARAAGRTFLAEPAAGENARQLQARLLADSGVLHAVPQGGRVRVVSTAAPHPDAGPPAVPAGGAATGAPPRFEDGFMVLLSGTARAPSPAALEAEAAPPRPTAGEVAVEVRDLVRTFGTFTAVDHVSFEVRHGEIFGLLGPNGAGKTTTFRMLCGLLPATSGTLHVAGANLRTARASARQRIGYVAQKFSLYGQLSVLENLDFYARAYGLRGRRKQERIAWALTNFELEALARLPSARLPGGYQQRLSMAAALLHEPDILFLDEATSGADPLARREFWNRINTLAERGVTVIVTTHVMEEAEYCDRAAILDAGVLLAEGTPSELRRRARPAPDRQPTIEDAFLAIVEDARRDRGGGDGWPAA